MFKEKVPNEYKAVQVKLAEAGAFNIVAPDKRPRRGRVRVGKTRRERRDANP